MQTKITLLKDIVLLFAGCAPLVLLSWLWWRGIDASAPIWPSLEGWEILAVAASLGLPLLVVWRLARDAGSREKSPEHCDWLR